MLSISCPNVEGRRCVVLVSRKIGIAWLELKRLPRHQFDGRITNSEFNQPAVRAREDQTLRSLISHSCQYWSSDLGRWPVRLVTVLEVLDGTFQCLEGLYGRGSRMGNGEGGVDCINTGAGRFVLAQEGID